MSNRLDRRVVLAAVAALATAGGVVDSTVRADEDDHDHERARRALEEGRVRLLAEILEQVRPHLDGEVIGVELEREDGRFVYELKVITSSGRLRELEVDALTGKILKDEED